MTREESTRGDLRVQRTRKLIDDALIEVTVEKGFAAVTVQDIVKRAGINRATFYRHYQDKFDLLDQHAQAIYQLADNAPDPARAPGGDTKVEKTLLGVAQVLDHVRGHAKFYRVMLGKNGDPEFVEKIRHYIQKRIVGVLPESLLADKNSADLFLSYVSSGSVGILSWWLEHGMPYSPEQMVSIVSRFIAAILATLDGT
jgi:AcrR family transcriptional regulator